MMLGFLLARAGVDVVVLEKHADFLRDFRGDTIHPSTLEVMHELGLLDEFLERPHQEARELTGQVGGDARARSPTSRHLPTHCKFIALMPQWDFLDFLAEQRASATRASTCSCRPRSTDLIEEDGRVVGVRAHAPDGPLEVRAELVVGADGRHSTVRASGRARGRDLGAPIDVLWMRLSRRPSDPGDARSAGSTRGQHPRHARPRRLLAVRASSSPRAAYDAIRRARARGVPRARSPALAPFLARPRRRARRAGTTSSC